MAAGKRLQKLLDMNELGELPVELQSVAAYLQELLQSSNPTFQPALVPNYIKYKAPRITDTPKLHSFHTGGALATYEKITAFFTWILKETPKIEINESSDGKMLFGKKVEFKNGVKLIYLSEKNAIGINIPDNAFEPLRSLIGKLPPQQQQLQ